MLLIPHGLRFVLGFTVLVLLGIAYVVLRRNQ